MDSTALKQLPAEMQRFIALIEGNLHFLASMPMTREQAYVIKQRMCLPIGALVARNERRKPQMKLAVDIGSQ